MQQLFSILNHDSNLYLNNSPSSFKLAQPYTLTTQALVWRAVQACIMYSLPARPFPACYVCPSKLDISYNDIGSNGAKAIAIALKQCTHLEELNIRDNQIRDVGLCVLASTFCHYAQCLHKLDISNNDIRGNVNAIANALKQCTHLEELSVNRNTIGDYDACIIASTFSHYSQSLHKLCMNTNNIGSKGCKAIARALQHCVNLKELDLSYNHLKDDDFVVLASALRHCTGLHSLDICGNSIGGKGLKAIHDLDINKLIIFPSFQ